MMAKGIDGKQGMLVLSMNDHNDQVTAIRWKLYF
jgi:hypothetical protein